MESGAITDGQISASSEHSAGLAAPRGRLNLPLTESTTGAWTALTLDDNQWLQVDLGWTHSTVTQVATQGRNNVNQWVTRYKLQYSNDGINFHYYREQGHTTDKVNYCILPHGDDVVIP